MDYEDTVQVVPVELLEDELTTRQAAERYGCENNYSTFHNRMVKLEIKPERRGRQSFLNAEQIEILDRLDTYLKSGGTFATFEKEVGATKSMGLSKSARFDSRTNNSSITTTGSIGDTDIVAALQLIAMKNYDVLSPQKKLLEAVTHKFLLTTDQVAAILGYSRNTISSWESGTYKIGFSFAKIKEGSSTLWQISKVER